MNEIKIDLNNEPLTKNALEQLRGRAKNALKEIISKYEIALALMFLSLSITTMEFFVFNIFALNVILVGVSIVNIVAAIKLGDDVTKAKSIVEDMSDAYDDHVEDLIDFRQAPVVARYVDKLDRELIKAEFEAVSWEFYDWKYDTERESMKQKAYPNLAKGV